MHIEERKVTVREITEGYFNDAEEGVVGYDEQLDIRPKYQREFVYKDAQRDEVIRTIMKGLPLNVMYWVDRGEQYEDDIDTPRYEVLDGQQRTISICEYVEGNFSVDDKGFHNLPVDIQEKILDYELFVYVCEGTDSEKLEWFRIINIAGEQLTEQELRNAVYAGSWVSDAKRYFSKTGCAASTLADDYLKGSSIRQEYLETAIKWAAAAEGKTVEDAKRYFSKTGCAASTLADDYLKGSSIRQEYLETAIKWAAAAEGKTVEGYMAEQRPSRAIWPSTSTTRGRRSCGATSAALSNGCSPCSRRCARR